MKKVQWFKTGENIPSNAKWLKSEKRKENFRWIDCDCHYMSNCNCHKVDIVDYHLYEISEEKNDNK